MTALSFFTVAGAASGLSRRLLSSVDATRKLASLEFSGVEAELLGELGAGATALERTLDQAAIALTNEMVGGAQKVLETSVEYAKERVQFGRPIGSFQAIKHKCADVLIEVELAKVGGLPRSRGRRGGRRGAAGPRLARQGARLRHVPAGRSREHPDPRRHRLHLGGRRAPLLQARQGLGGLPGRPDVPPRALRPALGDLNHGEDTTMSESTEEGVRGEVRAWLEASWNPDMNLRDWRDLLVDSGWGCPTWPKEWFGRNLPWHSETS